MDNNSFEYTYSPQRQKKVEEIRKVYLPKEEDRITVLRKFHAISTKKAQAAAIAIGLIGALIIGAGMSLYVTKLGTVLGSLAMVLGVLVGIVGMEMAATAYPLYTNILKKEREKIAPDIHLTI